MVETPRIKRDWRKLVDDARPWELEPFYTGWVSDLTAHDLHSKADIATALAILERELHSAREVAIERAKDVERLRRQVVNLRTELREATRDAASEANWKNKQGDEYGSY